MPMASICTNFASFKFEKVLPNSKLDIGEAEK
jgi:hypothetical protein